MRILWNLIFLACALAAQAYQWGSVAVGGGGFVSSVLAHPGERHLFYARTDVGGAYRWVESTQSWAPLLDGLSNEQTSYYGVESMAIDPQNPSRLYLYAGTSYWNNGISAILRSNDYGRSFSVTPVSFAANGNGPGRGTGEKLAVDPNLSSILLCGSRSSGLWRSTDAGVSWSQLSSFPVSSTPNGVGISFVAFDGASGTNGKATPRIFVGLSRMGSSNVYVSNDGGNSWSAVSGQSTAYMPQRAAVSADRKLYVTYANGASPNGVKNDYSYDAMNAGALLAYDIAKGTWADKSPKYGGATPPLSGISLSPGNANILVVTSTNTYKQQAWGWGDLVWTSSDGGSTWTNLMEYGKASMDANGMPWIKDHALHWAAGAALDPFDSNRLFVTSGNGIFLTKTRASSSPSWLFAAKGIEEVVVNDAVSVPGGPVVTAIWDYDGFRNYSPTTYAASQMAPNLGYTQGIAVASLKPQYMARSGSALQVSLDTGLTWSALSGPGGYVNGRLSLSADGNSLLWASGKSLYRNRRNGTGNSWNGWKASAIPGFSDIRPIADPVNPAKFYAYDRTTGNFYASSDSGKTFSLGTSPGSWAHDRLAVAPGQEGDLWIASFNNKIVRLKGNTATSMVKSILSNVDYCEAISLGKAPAAGGYPTLYMYGKISSLSSSMGMYRSTDQGKSWIRIDDDKHRYGGLANGGFVQADWNVFGRIYRSTAGQGLVYGDDNSSSSTTSSSSVAASSSSSAVSSSSVKVSSSSVASSSSVKVSSSSVASSSSGAKTACIAFVNGVGGYLEHCYDSGLSNMAANTCYTQNPSTSAVAWINGNASETYWWSVAPCGSATSSSSMASSSSVKASSSSAAVSSSGTAPSSSSVKASSSSIASSSSSAVSSSSVKASSSSVAVSSSSTTQSSSSAKASSSSAASSSGAASACIAFVNGVGGYDQHCYSGGLSYMASGTCYTLNPARGSSPAWITGNANDSWWWSPVSCSQALAKPVLASSLPIASYRVYGMDGKPLMQSAGQPKALPSGRWLIVAQDQYGAIVGHWISAQP